MSHDADVVIIGAGPVGLTLGNLLGADGVRVVLLEAGAELVDYPRAVGIDDEALRTMQTIGLVDEVLPHTVPNQKIFMVNGDRAILSEVDPRISEFGWPRRNGFVQPLVDRVLLAGLGRFPNVDVRFGAEVTDSTDDGSAVTVSYRTADGATHQVTATYLVGADGGSSPTRKRLGLTFEGETRATKGLVIDVNNDPIGTPHAVFGGDPKRGYATIRLPHGIRRWEFTLFEGEDEALVEDDAFVFGLLRSHVPDPEALDIIRRRVYTHHARVAGAFRVGRTLLAGDAAHVMPVVGGQGWNSGIRDALNLGWKLSAVVRGLAGDGLLDTYESERFGHVSQMVAISLNMAEEMTSHDEEFARERDRLAAARTAEEREQVRNQAFKPQPHYLDGAVVTAPSPTYKTLPAREVPSTAGTLFPQPRVRTTDACEVLLDHATGQGWRVIMWDNDPTAFLGDEVVAQLARLGGSLVRVVPTTQLPWDRVHTAESVVVVGDDGALKDWFDARPVGAVIVRPDHIIAAECLAQDLEATLRQVFAVAHVAQPAEERGEAVSAGAVAS
ncbi:bifunctional 3-(3-hydroxy-phenyl)propionate/3-hydroxycinnamic acid hydroxylase [Gryllotalpicola koreensis]|uniref:Bifunctional 3-(3-hydroxy-phenyl)propionate/3-hydroxycinnamic acid hydroxylase n=1 Tax=Gryllotalpicola koreensis TaxID=993086 RepID=A0ABP7ZRM0_9MICO